MGFRALGFYGLRFCILFVGGPVSPGLLRPRKCQGFRA